MKCIVSGGTGFIGRRLVASLLEAQHYVAVWSRRPGLEARNSVASFYWDPSQGEPAEESLNDFDAVVHLAGEPVSQRWTPEVKRNIRDSRVLGTRHLVDALAKTSRRPAVLVCASATGYYGARGDELLDETAPAGSGFLADLCREWEAEADRAEALGMRVVKIRAGIVLGREGGMLRKMVPAFRAFAGGRMGSGKQWISWIQADDLAAMFRYAVEHPVAGVWNGVAPRAVTNAQFTAELGKALKRPALLRIPPFALKLAFGELADSMVTGSHVEPRAAQDIGFVWRYPDLAGALACELTGPGSA